MNVASCPRRIQEFGRGQAPSWYATPCAFFDPVQSHFTPDEQRLAALVHTVHRPVACLCRVGIVHHAGRDPSLLASLQPGTGRTRGLGMVMKISRAAPKPHDVSLCCGKRKIWSTPLCKVLVSTFYRSYRIYGDCTAQRGARLAENLRDISELHGWRSGLVHEDIHPSYRTRAKVPLQIPCWRLRSMSKFPFRGLAFVASLNSATGLSSPTNSHTRPLARMPLTEVSAIILLLRLSHTFNSGAYCSNRLPWAGKPSG